MSGHPLAIAQVNAFGEGGGAERIARQLLVEFRRHGHDASLLVGRGKPVRQQIEPHVYPFRGGAWTRLAHLLSGPMRIVDRYRGLETFRYPATGRMLDLLPAPPDIVHLHNLHGGYFDLRVLPELSSRLPVVMTLHDAWLLSGHCAHSLGCERWRTGCGSCPDLNIYPAVRRDATARNWARKKAIFRRSRVHVATPSRWLADKVESSILAPAMQDLRVIPNGVALEVFRPADAREARAELRLPAKGFLLLYVGSNIGTNPFKDHDTVCRAAARVSKTMDQEVTLVVLGGAGPDSREGRLLVHHVPFESDSTRIARYYQACDLYLHAARAETFPLAVLEALACGRPVVATAVGGIPEQVRSLAGGVEGRGPPGLDRARATGILVAPADPEAMANAACRLLGDRPLRTQLGENAVRDARLRFDIRRQAQAYLEWYRDLDDGWCEGRDMANLHPDDRTMPSPGSRDRGTLDPRHFHLLEPEALKNLLDRVSESAALLTCPFRRRG